MHTLRHRDKQCEQHPVLQHELPNEKNENLLKIKINTCCSGVGEYARLTRYCYKHSVFFLTGSE